MQVKVQFSDPAGSFVHNSNGKQVQIELQHGCRPGQAFLCVGLSKPVNTCFHHTPQIFCQDTGSTELLLHNQQHACTTKHMLMHPHAEQCCSKCAATLLISLCHSWIILNVSNLDAAAAAAVIARVASHGCLNHQRIWHHVTNLCLGCGPVAGQFSPKLTLSLLQLHFASNCIAGQQDITRHATKSLMLQWLN